MKAAHCSPAINVNRNREYIIWKTGYYDTMDREEGRGLDPIAIEKKGFVGDNFYKSRIELPP